MGREDLISANEFCSHYHVSQTFIVDLQLAGLVELELIEGEAFLHLDCIREAERLMRLHTELEINMEGLNAVAHLLKKIDDMERELRELKGRLRAYER